MMWIWILIALVVIVGIVWWMMRKKGGSAEDEGPTAPGSDEQAPPQPQ